MTENRSHTLFTPSGCLTAETLSRYHNGTLSGDEKARVDSHLDSCELCRDALEGLALMAEPEKIHEIISEVNQNLRKGLNATKPEVKRISVWWMYGSAAAIALILFGLLFWLNESKFSGKLNNPMVELIDMEKYNSVPEKPLPAGQSRKLPEASPAKEEIENPVQQRIETDELINESLAIEDAEEVEQPRALAIRQPQLTSLKALKGDDTSIHSLVDNPSARDNQQMPKAIDLASAQPLEFYIGEVVVYNDDNESDAGMVVGNYARTASVSANRPASKSSSRSISSEASEEETLALDENMSSGEKPKSNYLFSDSAQVNTHFFTTVESMPEFPGGKKGLSEYFNKTLTYPRQARNQGVQGTVYLRFVIRTDGSVTDVFIVQGIGGGCDEEALRAIQSMPHWTPAKQNHQNVPVLITIPVSFRLR